MKLKLFKIAKFLGRKGMLWLGIGMLCGILSSFIEIALSKVLQMILATLGIVAVDLKLPFGLKLASASLENLAIVLISIGIIRGIIAFLINQSAQVSLEVIGTRLRMVAFHSVLAENAGFTSISTMNNKLGEVFPKATAFCYYISLFIPNFIYCILLIGFMGAISLRQTAIASAGILVIGAIVFNLNRHVRKHVAKIPVEHAEMSKRITRVIRNIFLLRTLRTTEREHLGLIKSTLNYSTHAIRANFLINVGSALPPVLGVMLLVFLISSYKAHPTISSVEFFSFLYLLMRLIQLLANLATQFGACSSSFPHFKLAASYFFGFSPETLSRALVPASYLSMTGGNLDHIHQSLARLPIRSRYRTETEHPAPSIEIKNLSFAYQADHPIIKNLNLKLEPGKQLGIIGESGSGKSTLLSLILGLLEPQSGQVWIDERPTKLLLDQSPWTIGYVGADPFLIDGTVRENLLYGLEGDSITDSDCFEALKAARLFDWLQSEREGLNYRLNENGEGLSTGQKQRLSLARALLARPKLLVLDEVSSNLDEATESEIAESIHALKGICTTLIVSHRPGILKYADARIELVDDLPKSL